MWSAVILRIRDHDSTRSPGQGSTVGCAMAPAGPGAWGRRCALDIAQDVLLRYTPREATPGNARDVDAVLGRDLTDERRGFRTQPLFGGLDPAAITASERGWRLGPRGWGCRCGSRFGLRWRWRWRCRRRGGRGGPRSSGCPLGCCGGGCGRGGALIGFDHRHERLHGNCLTFLHLDLDQHAGVRRRDLGVHLVGRDLEQRLVPFHLVAELLEPLGERPFGDRLAHLGHEDVYARHRVSINTPQAILQPVQCLPSGVARSLPMSVHMGAARRARSPA